MFATHLTRTAALSRKVIVALILLSSAVLFAGCSGGGGGAAFFTSVTASEVHSSTGSQSPAPTQLTGIAIGPPDARITVGSTLQFAATALYSDGTKQVVSSGVAWSSSNPAVASISTAAGSLGLATALGTGSTKITAILGNLSASTTLTTTAATLVSIGVTPAYPSIASGTATAFKATGVYSDNSTRDLTTSVTWTSSATTVASVDNSPGGNGLATGRSVGATQITASLQGVSGSTVLTVTAATVISISVTPVNPTLAKGIRQPLTATAVYSDESVQDVTTQANWISSNPSVASVGNGTANGGQTTALSTGSATITAMLAGVSASTTVTVTAAQLVSIGIVPAKQNIAKGLSSSLTATGIYTDSSTQNLTTSVTWTSSDPTVASISNAS